MPDGNRRVLRYRPRTSDHPPGRRFADAARSDDGAPETPDDFRYRMRANIAAFLFTVALTVAGVWLAFSIAEMRATQDCVLMGRRNCLVIPAPAANAAAERTRFAAPAAEQP